MYRGEEADSIKGRKEEGGLRSSFTTAVEREAEFDEVAFEAESALEEVDAGD